MRLVVLSSILFLFVSNMPAEKRFDFVSTPGKLPKTVVPTDYSIRIEPNLDNLTFIGSETVKLDVRAPVRALVLNAAEIEVENASVDDKAVPADALKIDKENELLRINLANELSTGPHKLALNFSGKINEQGRGLYYMPYQEEGTGAKKITLGTQFEATDARRFFPCWDEPAFRARFQLTVVVLKNWLAVSNMPIESEAPLNGRARAQANDTMKEVRFAPTPLMSSYLNVLVAGELESIETKVGDTQVRVIATKGKAESGRYALESTAQILQYYNDYFGEPYPLPKLDQIAIPGGFGGAMENWGGITYFEPALLFDPAKSSARTKQIVYEVIAHETAHQWFGDLVTMAWWDNLWLNEGFASWMGTKCTAHFNPQWDVWLRKEVSRDPTNRIGIPKEQAMEYDARSTTHPIQQPIANESEANDAFDDITYQKGQAFLFMLESFLGEDVFRGGIRRYIAAHKYSNSTTADLWKALTEASGKPVGEIAAGWTEQPGFPVVTVKRDADEVSLTQERFTINFPKAPPLQWKIPLTYSLVGDTQPQSRLMTGKIDNLSGIAADRALKLNAEGAGNYRVQYDERSWNLLLAALPKLSVPDRVNLLGDAWALAQAGRANVSQYLEIIDKLPNKTELAEREQIINAFDFINRLLVANAMREKFQAYACSILRPSFDELGWEPKKTDTPRHALLRASLISALGDLEDRQVIAVCRERFAKYLADPGSLAPDQRASVLWVVGHEANDQTWNKLHERGLNTTSLEEKAYCYDALAAARDAKLATKTLQIALTDELPTSRAVFIVGKVARYGGQPDLAWDFAKANMKALLAKTDALGANSLAPSLFSFFSEPARADELRADAKSDLPKTAAAAKEVAKAVDEIEFRSDFKRRLARQLADEIEKRK